MYGKGLRDVCVPMGSTGKAGASPSAALLQECIPLLGLSKWGAGSICRVGSHHPCWASGIEEHPQRESFPVPPQRQARRDEWAGRAEQAGPRGCNWILLGHAEPIDPVVIKVSPKPDSYSTLGGRSFAEKHPLLLMVWHRMEQSVARVLPGP